MTDERYKPATGVAVNLRAPDDDDDERRELYRTDPIVYEMCKLYAREHGLDIEDVVLGPAGDEIHVGAPRLGCLTVNDAAKTQRLLNQALRVGAEDDDGVRLCAICGENPAPDDFPACDDCTVDDESGDVASSGGSR